MSKPVVELSGEIDVFTAPVACRPLHGIAGPATIDLSGVTFFSAAGVSELIALAKRVGPGEVDLLAPHADVRRVLEICRLDELFRIRNDGERS